MSSAKPLISVYLPTHNRVEFLKAAVASVLDQTYQNFELIICDDGSVDGTEEYCNELCSRERRVKYLRNYNSLGACVSRNKAIKVARGEYITGLDDDDLFAPNRLEEFYDNRRLLESDFSFLCTSLKLMNELGEIVSFRLRKSERISFNRLLFGNVVGNQIFAKSEIFSGVGGFDETCPAWQDFDLWVRICSKYGDGFRLRSNSYLVRLPSKHRPSITTSSNAHKGYLYFVNKHSRLISKNQRQSLALGDLMNRGEKLGLKDMAFFLNYRTAAIAGYYTLRMNFPLFGRIYDRIVF